MLAARARLERAGLTADDAAVDARLLAQHVLGWDTARFLSSETDTVPDRFADAYDALVGRRLRREPLAYITGIREFWNLDFEVTPAVLIPRPETELLVATALERWPEPRGQSTVRVADVCTGSGCIAVALAYERLSFSVVATDLSAAALSLAGRNAARHQVATRVECVRTDLLADVPGPFALIIANPPYVPDDQRTMLQREVADYEPPLALFAGPGGLNVIIRLIAQASSRLEPEGLLMFEFGAGQEPAIVELIAAATELRMVDIRRDLQGIPRAAVARRI